MRSLIMLTGATALSVAALVQAQPAGDLERLLACEDVAALAQGHEPLATAATASGFACREQRSALRQTSLACAGGSARVFGASVREFELARQPDGGSILSVVLNSTPSALRPRLDARLSADADADAVIELDTREDGRAEVRCTLAGERPPFGAIAGTLDFRGQQPLPAMRVCATPVTRHGPPTCVQTRTGQHDYLIEDLPAGDYYLTAFATESNPNRLFGVYSSPITDCGSGAACERQRLQPVTVVPGDVRSGINPDTLLPRLPAFLRDN